MTSFLRERDVVTLVKGNANVVLVDSTLASNGWAGGQGVTWVESVNDEFMVTSSDGTFGGFLLWGSNEDSDQHVSTVGGQTTYRFATMCAGSWIISTRTFERYTWASRQAGPLVALSYQVGERLRFSLRGFFTKEDEWALSGDPRGSNQLFVGSVAQGPSDLTRGYITIQTSI